MSHAGNIIAFRQKKTLRRFIKRGRASAAAIAGLRRLRLMRRREFAKIEAAKKPQPFLRLVYSR